MHTLCPRRFRSPVSPARPPHRLQAPPRGTYNSQTTAGPQVWEGRVMSTRTTAGVAEPGDPAAPGTPAATPDRLPGSYALGRGPIRAELLGPDRQHVRAAD